MSFSTLGEVNSCPPNPLAGFERPLRGGNRVEKGKKEGKRKGSKGMEGMGLKHSPPSPQINFWL